MKSTLTTVDLTDFDDTDPAAESILADAFDSIRHAVNTGAGVSIVGVNGPWQLDVGTGDQLCVLALPGSHPLLACEAALNHCERAAGTLRGFDAGPVFANSLLIPDAVAEPIRPTTFSAPCTDQASVWGCPPAAEPIRSAVIGSEPVGAVQWSSWGEQPPAERRTAPTRLGRAVDAWLVRRLARAIA